MLSYISQKENNLFMSLLQQLKQKFHHRPVLPPLDDEYINERLDLMEMFNQYEPLKRFVTRKVTTNKHHTDIPFTELMIVFQDDTLVVRERPMLTKDSAAIGSPTYKILKLYPNGQFDYLRCNIQSIPNPSTTQFDELVSVYNGEKEISRLISAQEDRVARSTKNDLVINQALQNIKMFNYLQIGRASCRERVCLSV